MTLLTKLMELFPHIDSDSDEKCHVVTVDKDENLSTIAHRLTGDGNRWHELMPMNPQIKDPNLIHPGDKIHIPKTWPVDD